MAAPAESGGKWLEWPWILAFSMIWGLVLVVLASVETRYAAALGVGLVIFTVPLFLENKRMYFLSLMTLTLFLGNNKMIASVTNIWPYDLIERMTLSITDVLLAASCAIWFFSSIGAKTKPAPRRRHLLMPMGCLILSVLFSFVNSTYPILGVFELVRMAKALLLYWFLIHNIRSREEVRLLVALLAFNIFVQFVITLLQKYGGSTLGLSYFGEVQTAMESMMGAAKVFRAGGTLGHPNHLAYCLDLLIPLMFSMSFSSALSDGRRAYFTLAFGAACVCLYLTLSRGGLVATAVAMSLALAFILRRNFLKRQFTERTAATLLAILIAAGGAALPLYNRFIKDDAGAFKTRVYQWRVAYNIIGAHPWAGVGLNNYRNVAPAYDDTPVHISTSFTYPVHNVYLLAFAETGILGLLGLLALLIAALNMAYFGRWSYGEPYDLHLGFFFGFLAYIIHTNVDINPPGSYVFFYFLLGLLTAAHGLEAQSVGAPQ